MPVGEIGLKLLNPEVGVQKFNFKSSYTPKADTVFLNVLNYQHSKMMCSSRTQNMDFLVHRSVAIGHKKEVNSNWS